MRDILIKINIIRVISALKAEIRKGKNNIAKFAVFSHSLTSVEIYYQYSHGGSFVVRCIDNRGKPVNFSLKE